MKLAKAFIGDRRISESSGTVLTSSVKGYVAFGWKRALKTAPPDSPDVHCLACAFLPRFPPRMLPPLYVPLMDPAFATAPSVGIALDALYSEKSWTLSWRPEAT